MYRIPRDKKFGMEGVVPYNLNSVLSDLVIAINYFMLSFQTFLILSWTKIKYIGVLVD